MKTALFTNFTDEDFVGYWDGKGKKIPAGKSLWMPDYLAKHFAKLLANKELVRKNEDGTEKYKGGETMTSPKKPEEVPVFMELFNKAYTPDNTEDIGDNKDDIDTLIKTANKNRAKRGLNESKQESDKNEEESEEQDSSKPQVVLPPDFEKNEDEDNESSFEGNPAKNEE